MSNLASIPMNARVAACSSGAISRREVMIWLAVCLMANQALHDVKLSSFSSFAFSLASLNLFNWFAFFVIVRLLAASDRAMDASRLDVVFAITTGLAVCVSSLFGYRVGIGILATSTAAYFLLATGACLYLRSAGIVLLAVATHLVWAPILFQLLTPELLRFDAALVGFALSGVRPDIAWTGTTFSDSFGHTISLVGGCSSFENVSIAVLACVTMTMFLRTRWSRRDASNLMLVCAAMVLFNTMRLCLLIWSRSAYEFWHEDAGAPVFALVQTAAIALLAYWGASSVRRKA